MERTAIIYDNSPRRKDQVVELQVFWLEAKIFLGGGKGCCAETPSPRVANMFFLFPFSSLDRIFSSMYVSLCNMRPTPPGRRTSPRHPYVFHRRHPPTRPFHPDTFDCHSQSPPSTSSCFHPGSSTKTVVLTWSSFSKCSTLKKVRVEPTPLPHSLVFFIAPR